MGRFNFTGTLRYNTSEKRFSSYRTGKMKDGNKYNGLTLFINSDENNSGTVEIMGSVQDEIKTKDTDGNDLTIDWDDRKDKDVVSSVAGYRKNVISDGDERHEFVSPYDFVDYVWENIDDLKGKKVTVTGQLKKNVYNGKISDRFQMQNIYIADDKKKPGLMIKEEIFFNKDSFDFNDFKEEKKIYVNAYTKEWVDKEHPAAYVGKTYVIDCSKIDFDDEKMVKLFNGRWLPLELKYEKGKLSVNLKSSKYYSMMVDVSYKNGSEEEEFTEDMLTPLQKQQLDLGLKTLDDFRPAGRTFGNRIVEYKLVNCDIRGDFADGKKTLDDSVDDFESEIYSVATNDEEDIELGINEPEEEEKPKKKEKKVEKKVEEEEEEDDLDSLFD